MRGKGSFQGTEDGDREKRGKQEGRRQKENTIQMPLGVRWWLPTPREGCL